MTSRRNPYNDSNPFSKAIFSWLSPLFKICGKRPLVYDDLWDAPSVDKSEHQMTKLEYEWKKEQKTSSPSLNYAILRAYKPELWLSAVCLVLETVLLTMRPMIVGWMIQDFADIRKRENLISGGINAAYLVINMVISVLTRNAYFWIGYRAGMNLRISTSGLLFKKILQLNQKALCKTTTGEIVNLLSSDVQRYEQTFIYGHYSWIGIVQALCVLGIMVDISGFAPVISVIVMLFFVALQSCNGNIYAQIKLKIAMDTDSRVKLLSGIVGGIRAIKMYCWEPIFSGLVRNIRRQEIAKYMLSRYCQVFQFSQLVYQPKIAMMLLFISIMFVLKDDSAEMLSSYRVFTIFGLINSLFISLTLFMPNAIQFIAESQISSRRIRDFLCLSELGKETQACGVNKTEPEMQFCRVNANWDEASRSATLSDIHFQVKGVRLIGVVGNVGCGKTSLLLAALGELPLASGYVMRSKSAAYLPQLAWVSPGSIRENVLCGAAYDPVRYREVLKATTLDVDCKRMPYGDLTLVGERGVSLSGGQKARIGLARVSYAKTQIVLLDDPLAAVDAKVSGILFRNCIQSFLSDRLRILVTHQHHLLQKMDAIIVMKSGRISHFGHYNTLTQEGLNLAGLCDVVEAEVRSRRSSLTKHGSQIDDLVKALTKLNEEENENENEQIEEVDTGFHGLETALNKIKTSSAHESPQVSQRKQIQNHENSLDGAEDQILLKSLNSVLNESDSVSYNPEDQNVIDEGVDEIMARGTVPWKFYYIYGTTGCGLFGLLLVILLFILTIVLYAICDIWIAKWTNYNDLLILNQTQIVNLPWFPSRENSLLIYGVMTAALLLLSSFRTFVFFRVFTLAAKKIHHKMFHCITYTRMYFFETNTSGRILNRFSKDISQVDDLLPMTVHDFLQCFCLVLESAMIALLTSYYVLIPLIPIVVAFFYGRHYYLSVARDLKRIDGLVRSPIFTHITVTIQGLACIRSANAGKQRLQELHHLIDLHTRVFFLNIAAQRWISLRLDFLCVLFTTAVVFICFCLGFWSTITPGDLGLVLSYTTGLVGLFQWCVRQSAEVENQMVSMERCLEYTSLLSEEETTEVSGSDSSFRVSTCVGGSEVMISDEWPAKGRIEFQGVWLRYHERAEWALRGVDLIVHPGHKIGIVGRTGAGKSSLISAIFRLVELTQGKILIDNIDLHRLPLKDMRSRISIIPQDPIMFAGTVRGNLDPEGKYSDGYLWHALHAVQLDELMQSLHGGLDAEIQEEGNNLSAGQRQLVSLARAILRGNKVLVVDEATANVDPNTDNIIQQTIRREFAECTVLTIAHRLHTIMDSDLVVVMDAGKVVEFGEPHALLNPDQLEDELSHVFSTGEFAENLLHDPRDPVTGKGHFANLIRQTGYQESRNLCKIACDAFYSTVNRANQRIRMQSGHV